MNGKERRAKKIAERVAEAERLRAEQPRCECGKGLLPEWAYCHFCGRKNAHRDPALMHVCRTCEKRRVAEETRVA